jgi:hypothetical protein
MKPCACGCGTEIAGRSSRLFVDDAHRERIRRRSARFWGRYGHVRRRPMRRSPQSRAAH